MKNTLPQPQGDTLQYYAQNAQDFVNATINADVSDALKQFIAISRKTSFFR